MQLSAAEIERGAQAARQTMDTGRNAHMHTMHTRNVNLELNEMK